MATCATVHVTYHLPDAERDRLFADAERKLEQGVDPLAVRRWLQAELGKAVVVRSVRP